MASLSGDGFLDELEDEADEGRWVVDEEEEEEAEDVDGAGATLSSEVLALAEPGG